MLMPLICYMLQHAALAPAELTVHATTNNPCTINQAAHPCCSLRNAACVLLGLKDEHAEELQHEGARLVIHDALQRGHHLGRRRVLLHLHHSHVYHTILAQNNTAGEGMHLMGCVASISNCSHPSTCSPCS